MKLRKTILTSLVFLPILFSEVDVKEYDKRKYSEYESLKNETEYLFGMDFDNDSQSPFMDPSWELMPLYQGENPILPFLFDYIERENDKEDRLRNGDFLLLYLDDVKYLKDMHKERKFVIWKIMMQLHTQRSLVSFLEFFD